jgi:hypothetical protein
MYHIFSFKMPLLSPKLYLPLGAPVTNVMSQDGQPKFSKKNINGLVYLWLMPVILATRKLISGRSQFKASPGN